MTPGGGQDSPGRAGRHTFWLLLRPVSMTSHRTSGPDWLVWRPGRMTSRVGEASRDLQHVTVGAGRREEHQADRHPVVGGATARHRDRRQPDEVGHHGPAVGVRRRERVRQVLGAMCPSAAARSSAWSATAARRRPRAPRAPVRSGSRARAARPRSGRQLAQQLEAPLVAALHLLARETGPDVRRQHRHGGCEVTVMYVASARPAAGADTGTISAPSRRSVSTTRRGGPARRAGCAGPAAPRARRPAARGRRGRRWPAPATAQDAAARRVSGTVRASGPDPVEPRSERHHTAHRHHAGRGRHPDDAALRGRLADRAAGVGADRERRLASGDRGRRSPAAAAGAAAHVVRVVGAAVGRGLRRRAHRQLVHVGPAEHDGSARDAAAGSRRRPRGPRRRAPSSRST